MSAVLVRYVHAVLVGLVSEADQVVVALARLDRLDLSAGAKAVAARVRVVGGAHSLEQLAAVDERLAHQLVLLAHATLAVRERPLVELLVKRALDVHERAEAGRDQDGRRHVVVRILGLVVHEHIEAALAVRADLVAPEVGQAGEQLHLDDRVVLYAGHHGHDRLDRLVVRVEARVEAIAAQVQRMPDPLEPAFVAIAAGHLAVHEYLRQVAQLALLLVAHVGARGLLHMHLHVDYGASVVAPERLVGGRQELDTVVGIEGID